MIRKCTFLHIILLSGVINSLDYNPINWRELSTSFTLALNMLVLSLFCVPSRNNAQIH